MRVFMNRRLHGAPLRAAAGALLGLVLTAPAVAAQDATSTYKVQADRQEQLSENHQKLVGRVEIENGATKLYADEAELFRDEDRVIATGNVSFSQGTNTIAADRADFNTKTRLGTFYNAYGIATIQQKAQRPVPGAVVVPSVATPTEVYFFGETVEKLGPKKFKITKGGFSTCVQPTPRWDLHADTVLLNLDHYTLLKQGFLNVKGVPLLYLPVMYFPTKEDGRQTGFLLPTYGSSSLRGPSFHNAFFWAINRSQDATFQHDWYSKTGQAIGSEYRYALGSGNGSFRGLYLDDHETVYPNGSVLPASKSFEIVGGGYQVLSPNLRARGNVDYFSDVQTMQTFNTNINDASRNRRTYGVNVVGSWLNYSLNSTFNRTENFYTTTSSVVTGDTPRVTFSRNDRPIFGTSPLYFSASSEFVHFVRETNDPSGATDTSLSRFDVFPQVRYPFKKWQWFTVNSTAAFRDTFYTRSLDPATSGLTVEGINRTFFTVQSQILGPVFNRVWITPANHYAERFKHTIEPTFSVSRTSTIDNFNSIVKTDGTDQAIGTTTLAYGVNNRFYAKRKIGTSPVSQAQEVVTVSLTQSYYTNNQAAQYDHNYQTTTSNVSALASNFSPIALDVRATPTPVISATMHTEIDNRYHAIRLLTTSGTYNLVGRFSASAGWTHKYFIPQLPGFNDPTSLDNFLNVQSSAQTRDNKYGVRYSFYYDVLRSTMVQQTLVGFYTAQCCGIAFQYAPRN